jgi:pyruvate/2-oxoglutarate dehydrogenase complex dihydrolipoamide acyltransferase (E2) component
MKATIKMPKVADTADNVVVSEIHCAAGSTISEGDVLMHVETDKALVEVPSPVSGVIREILVDVDEEIVTGTPIVTIDTN